jgi:DDE superfamily endonuclease
LGNIAFVLDGMVTPLAEAPRAIQRGGGSVSGRAREEFFCARYSTYAINNLIAVDSRGRIVAACTGWPGSASDSMVIREFPFWSAMEALSNYNEVNDKRPPQCLPQNFVAIGGFALRDWCITPLRQVNTRRGSNAKRRAVYNFLLGQVRVISKNCFGRFVDSVGLGDRRGCDKCKELLESEQWLAL